MIIATLQPCGWTLSDHFSEHGELQKQNKTSFFSQQFDLRKVGVHVSVGWWCDICL